MYEIKREIEGEEDVLQKLQGELKKGPPKRGKSYISLLGDNPQESFDKWNASSALLNELEPLVRAHQKEFATVGSL